MKRAWDPVTLTRIWWDGPEPRPGDGLVTKTGRKYLILEVKGKRLHCMVLPKEETIDGRTFEWTWAERKRRRPWPATTRLT